MKFINMEAFEKWRKTRVYSWNITQILSNDCYVIENELNGSTRIIEISNKKKLRCM